MRDSRGRGTGGRSAPGGAGCAGSVIVVVSLVGVAERRARPGARVLPAPAAEARRVHPDEQERHGEHAEEDAEPSPAEHALAPRAPETAAAEPAVLGLDAQDVRAMLDRRDHLGRAGRALAPRLAVVVAGVVRSEEHTSELQSRVDISYA